MSVASTPVLAVGRLLERVRRRWIVLEALRGCAWALAASVGAAIVLIIADMIVPMSAAARGVLRWIPPVLLTGMLAWSAPRIADADDTQR